MTPDMNAQQQWRSRIIEQLADSCTALVCNALDLLGIAVPYLDGRIRCLTPHLPALVGEAYTIKIDSSTPGNTADNAAMNSMIAEMEHNPLPKVMVVQTLGQDPYRECVGGDGMAKLSLAAGCFGCITDGGWRDLRDTAKQGFRVFGVGSVVSHTPLRYSAVGEPVTIGGVTIRQGDLIHADEDGCIVVPESSLPRIVDACRLVLDFEKKAHLVMRLRGVPVEEKRKRVASFYQEALEQLSKEE